MSEDVGGLSHFTIQPQHPSGRIGISAESFSKTAESAVTEYALHSITAPPSNLFYVEVTESGSDRCRTFKVSRIVNVEEI